MSNQDGHPKGDDTISDTASSGLTDKPTTTIDDSCADCGADVTWFTLREFAEHIKDNPERRAATKALIEQSTEAFGPALDLRFKECVSCGDATAVSSMRLDPSTGHVVRKPTALGAKNAKH